MTGQSSASSTAVATTGGTTSAGQSSSSSAAGTTGTSSGGGTTGTSSGGSSTGAVVTTCHIGNSTSTGTGGSAAGGCQINGQIYPNQSLNPADLTQCCNARVSPNAWLPLFSRGPLVSLLVGGNDEVSADFDADGSDDVAIADGNGNVEVFFGEAGGSWSAPVVIPIGTEFLRPVSGDLNCDGLPDIVVGSGQATGNAIYVALNLGNHQFAAPLVITAPQDCRVDPVRIGDFDGDGWPDVVVGLARVGQGCADGQVGLYRNLGDGSGQLAAPIFLMTGSSQTGDVRVGDFNGDGQLDIAVSDFENTVAFFLNAGGGSYPAAVSNSAFLPQPFDPYDLVVGRYSPGSDGVAVSSGSNPYVAFVGIGQQPLTTVAAKYQVDATYGTPTPIASSIDVNGDGLPDALFANGGVLDLLINQPDGSFLLASPSIAIGGGGVQMITVGDLNGDGAPDLAVIYGDGQWGSWLNSCPP